jgi:hypothetical protein
MTTTTRPHCQTCEGTREVMIVSGPKRKTIVYVPYDRLTGGTPWPCPDCAR